MIRETYVQYVAAVYAVAWVVMLAYVVILNSKLGRSSASSPRSRASWRRRPMDDAAVALHLVLVGTSHRSAPLPVRERLAAHDHGRDLVDHVLAAEPVAEAVGLATCNRCELYLVGSRPEALREAAVERLVELSGRDRAQLEPMLYVRTGAEAAEHLFSVAAGLDSLVPGEAQILAQIRDAYAAAFEWGATGPVSNRLFHVALEAGKRVRHETAIGSGGASVASVAAEVAAERLGGLDGRLRARRRRRPGGRARRGQPDRARRAARSRSQTATPSRAAALAARFGGTRDRRGTAWRRRSTRPTSSSARRPHPGTSSTPPTCARAGRDS